MDIRKLFPALERRIYGKPLVYFDNAATAQRPLPVLELQHRMALEANGNVHRSMHKLGGDATDLYERGREAVRSFINAPARENVILTSGTTASVNLVASVFVSQFVQAGERILVSQAEHHSNLVPWQLACQRFGASIEVWPVDERGCLSLEYLDKVLSSSGGKIRLVAVAHISNVLGVVNPVEEIVRIAHRHGVPVLIDGAQGVVHEKVDVTALDCDFYAFSGHKIYAPTGTGVLYGKREWLEAMPPYMGGGEMIASVSFEETTYAPLPLKFEAGTPNFVGAACLAPALEVARSFRDDPAVAANMAAMRDFMWRELGRIDGVRILGEPQDVSLKAPIFSIAVEGAYPADMAQILDKMGVEVRSGHACAEPLLRRFNLASVLRASLAPYNTLAECECFIASLRRAINMLR